jgi:cephalosporin-C deacetylase-like acetyl esterase
VQPFPPAVAGYYDVADQLSQYFRARADAHFSATLADKRALDSVAAIQTRLDRVREAFLDGIGGLPDRPPELAAERTGVLDRDGYAVEQIVFQSRPDFHVTANCYVPAGDGPHPGILFLCGHATEAKADAFNQRACIELVRNGFVVLIVDPVGQGEREQYRDPATGEAIVEGGGGVFEHCYAGQGCFYAGQSLARYMVHDDRCAFAYLRGRDDVDPGRVGVTGTSGGGLRTGFLALVEDRIAAAAPCCTVTDREQWLRTGKRIDAEQISYGAIPAGIDYDDYVTAMAPRPVCVGAAASDQYFPIEGLHDAMSRIREVYDLYDAGDAVELVVADEPHCSVYEIGDPVFEWLCATLDAGDYEPQASHALADAETLACTPGGSVRGAYADERTVDDLVAASIERRQPDGPDAVSPDGLRARVVERFDLERTRCDLQPRWVARNEHDGLTAEHVWFKSEHDPDVVCTGVLVSDPDVSTAAPAVVCYEDGTDAFPDRREDVAALAAEYGAALVFDPRGVGGVRHRDIPIPNWIDDYYGIYGTEFKLAYDALLLGSSLFGMRVFDVCRAVEFLRGETDCERVSLVGEGVGTAHALYAAVATQGVDTVELRDLGSSFREQATSHRYDYDPRRTVFDVLDCDYPHCLAALDERGVRVERQASDRAQGDRGQRDD